MPGPGLSVSGLRGELDVEALAHRRLELRIDSGQLFLSSETIGVWLPPGAPVRVEGLSADRVHLRVTRGLFPVSLELQPAVTAQGRLQLRPQGLVALLAGVFHGALSDMLRGKRGLYVTGGAVELDLAELLEPTGIRLAPLRSVRADSSGALLTFGDSSEKQRRIE